MDRAAIVKVPIAYCLILLVAVLLPWQYSVADNLSIGMNMLGRQSQNVGLLALPLKSPVQIDGRLDEWDLSGSMSSFSDINERDRFSVDTAAMWDADALYIACKWQDPTPMFNQINPKTNPEDGWKSDAVQLRIRTDHVCWLTAWYYTASSSANVHLVHYDNLKDAKSAQTQTFFGKPNASDLGAGLQLSFRKTGHSNYVQEMRIPWKLIYHVPPAMKAGNKLQIGFEFLWGDPTGKVFPACRYADNLQSGNTSREFFWTATTAWGDVELLSKGDVSLRKYRAAGALPEGPIRFSLSLPLAAQKFTVVIDDVSTGTRIRNLIADMSPKEFAGPNTASVYNLRLSWDGKSDDGVVVKPGAYRVRGLWHEGLDAIYDCDYYNPGTPPWATTSGTGGWGSNHAKPEFVVSSGDRVILGWRQTEGGSAIIGIGPDGLKQWGEERGACPLAADKTFVYACLAHGGKLMRLSACNGAYQPFVLNGQERSFPLALTEVLGDKESISVTAMSAYEGKLAMALANDVIAILDGGSAQLIRKIAVGNKVTALAYSGKGELFAVVNGGVVLVQDDGRCRNVKTPGAAEIGALAIDREGNVLVFDRGPDQQVKAFSTSGHLLYCAGKKGGRAIAGDFDGQTMSSVSAIAVDSKNQIWTTENTNLPRRVSVWGKNGLLIRDYIGGTGYAGVGCYFHEGDPTLAYVGPIEIKLDRATGAWRVKRILWKANESRSDEPKSFDINPQSAANAKRFCSTAGGVKREYLFNPPNRFYSDPTVLFMEDERGWRPVSAVGFVGHFSGSIIRNVRIGEAPSGEFAGLNGLDGCIWNDLNSDGRVQRSECVIVTGIYSRKSRIRSPLVAGNEWNNGIDTEDLSFLVRGIHRFKPLRFTRYGAPIYGVEGIERVTANNEGNLPGCPVPGENMTIGMRADGPGTNGLLPVPGLVGINKSGQFVWTYPNRYPGVHGSHAAPMPSPGLLIGPLKIMGVARVDGEAGNIFAIRGNLGQDTFFTTDGLYAGALFHDCRYATSSLPELESALKGKSMKDFSEGGEPFSGWFGRQADGKVRMLTSIARNSGLSVEVCGLEKIKRFKGPLLEIKGEDMQKIAAFAAAQPERAVERKVYSIRRIDLALPLDGTDESWSTVPPLVIARGGDSPEALVQLAHDGKDLYLRYRVRDKSPMLNSGKDYTRLFKTGDAVDLQLGSSERPERKQPGPSDVRLILSAMQNRPLAVLMRPHDLSSAKANAVQFTSPVGQKNFDRVEKLDDVACSMKRTESGYTISAKLPLSVFAIKYAPGIRLRGDVGIIASDNAGTTNVARLYWSNQQTGLVNDEPLEAWLYPSTWGDFILE